ncbi:MAG: hypothetical protein RJQ07_14670 [Pseudomonadales bacterium]
MKLFYRSSVNRWECDENDHLNVRFYVAKHMETLDAGMRGLGLWDGSEDLIPRISSHHLRFLAESRLAEPLSGYFGVLFNSDGPSRVLTELRHSHTQTVLCSCVHTVQLSNAAPMDKELSLTELPDHATVRGLDELPVDYQTTNRSNWADLGFLQTGAGIISEHEVNRAGRLELAGYMGRISDAMPHLWALLDGPGNDDGDQSQSAGPHQGASQEALSSGASEGGAILEYRLSYHSPLRLADQFTIYSGLRQAGAKVQQFVHLVYNETENRLAVTAEACGVKMDLASRKVVTLSSARLQHLQSLELLEII